MVEFSAAEQVAEQSKGMTDGGILLLHDGKALTAIKKGGWDFVVLQEHSLGASYDVTDAWTIGFTAIASSGRVLRGDEANLTARTDPFAVVNLNTTYRVAKGVEVFGLSMVTNAAAGITGEKLDHQEVLAAGRAAAGRLGEFLVEFTGRLP